MIYYSQGVTTQVSCDTDGDDAWSDTRAQNAALPALEAADAAKEAQDESERPQAGAVTAGNLLGGVEMIPNGN